MTIRVLAATIALSLLLLPTFPTSLPAAHRLLKLFLYHFPHDVWPASTATAHSSHFRLNGQNGIHVVMAHAARKTHTLVHLNFVRLAEHRPRWKIDRQQ